MRLIDNLKNSLTVRRVNTAGIEHDADGWWYPLSGSYSGDKEMISGDFEGYVEAAYKSNGIVFACVAARLLAFSEARFQYQRLVKGRPGDLYGDPSLALLETPWPNGTTGDLLARAEQDVSLEGNFYVTTVDDDGGVRLRRLRPDWVTIISGVRGSTRARPYDIGAQPLGYIYTPNGEVDAAVLLSTDRVAHYAPIPDPSAQWRGMSWLTPIVREIRADSAMTRHKLRYFENGAQSSLVVTYDPNISPDLFKASVALFNEQHKGEANAYKTIHLGGGTSAHVLAADLKSIDFKAIQGAAEPLALDTPIPTPSGWTTMGELAVGDEVFGRNGLPASVVGVSPVHAGRECYRVTFNDRTSIVADASHIWTAMDRNTKHRAPTNYTTAELHGLIAVWNGRGNGGNRIAVPPPAPLKGEARDLLVDPYVLGAWLGDGQTAGAAICGADDDLAVIAAEIESRGYTVTRWKPQPDKVSTIGLPGGLLAALRSVGVLGNKHIPAEYMRASIEQRLDLLRGLMDTDGTVGHIGKESCAFTSKYEALARQVAELVRSLGHRATVTSRLEPRSRTGETWGVSFRADPEMVPFLLPRKVARCRTPLWVKNRAIVSIEPVASVPVRCIAVDTPDHLFLAGEGMIPTHNTRIAAAAGVGSIIARLSEGLQGSSLNAGNYNAAKRQFADMTIRPLWRSAAGSFAKLVPVPGGSRLWYDARDVAFLAEDEKDAAEIMSKEAATIKQLVDAGYTPESVISAVQNKDFGLLAHSGFYSVQLRPPGDMTPEPVNA